MDNNNPYDTSLEWTNFYSQPTENVRPYPLTPAYQQEKVKPRPAVRRLSKQEALERVQTLKGYIVVATLLGFAALAGLVASQIVATNTVTLPGQSQGSPNIQQNPSGPAYNSAPSNSGGFFNQQGQGQGQGGYGFGQNNNSGPYSGSRTS
jgi:hypothetical protein